MTRGTRGSGRSDRPCEVRPVSDGESCTQALGNTISVWEHQTRPISVTHATPRSLAISFCSLATTGILDITGTPHNPDTSVPPCIFDLDSSTRDSRESLTAVQSESRERSWATNITELYLMHTVIMYMATLASLQRKPHARVPPPTLARIATRQPRSSRGCRACACAAAP